MAPSTLRAIVGLLALGLIHRTCAALPWLTVRPVDLAANQNSTRHFIIADEWGREVMLRGVNLEHEERNTAGPFNQRPIDPSQYANGSCPDNYNSFYEPPICQVDYGKGKYNASSDYTSLNDFAQMRALGLNVIRLCLSWSELESSPGVYNATYLDRVEQLVRRRLAGQRLTTRFKED